VTVIATSREPLGLNGEVVIRIPSLAKAHGIELFCDRTAAADSAFAPTQSDESAIADVCARLDGIPLAIELAAARIRSLSPGELLARLDDRFRLLRGGGHGGLERHQTLRAVDRRIPLAISSNLQLCAAYLASGPSRLAAATILGHPEIRFVISSANVRMREMAEAGVAGLDDLDALKAEGAAMTLNELVVFTFAHLDPA